MKRKIAPSEDADRVSKEECCVQERGAAPAVAGKSSGSPLSIWSRITIVILAVLTGGLCFFCGWAMRGALEPYEVRVARWMLETIERYSLYEPEMSREELDDMLYHMGLAALQYGISEQGEHYAAIYRPAERQELLQSFEGISQGYGLYLSEGKVNGESLCYLSKVLGNTPAAEAVATGGGENGLKKFDRPVALVYFKDGEQFSCNLQDLSLEEIRSTFAPVGDTMTLTVDRPVQTADGVLYTGENLLTFSLEARSYTPRYAEYYSGEEIPSLPEEAALVVLKSFNAPAAENFAECMEMFAAQGKRHLILDLRDNGGGLVAQTEAILAHLLDTGKSDGVRFAKEVDKNGKESYYSTAANYYDRYQFKSVQVLVNGNTASASELLLMAMQEFHSVDHVIGSKTFGKGIVQKYFAMDEGFTLKLTVAQIYDMNGRTIHGFEKGGIHPDIPIAEEIFLDFAHDSCLNSAIAVVEAIQEENI